MRTPDTDPADSPDAARLEACLHLLLSATTEEEFADAKAKARRIEAMTDEEVMALVQEPVPAPNQYARLASAAMRRGDRASARIYARQSNTRR